MCCHGCKCVVEVKKVDDSEMIGKMVSSPDVAFGYTTIMLLVRVFL